VRIAKKHNKVQSVVDFSSLWRLSRSLLLLLGRFSKGEVVSCGLSGLLDIATESKRNVVAVIYQRFFLCNSVVWSGTMLDVSDDIVDAKAKQGNEIFVLPVPMAVTFFDRVSILVCYVEPIEVVFVQHV